MVQRVVAGWNFAARHVRLRVCSPPLSAFVISIVWVLVQLKLVTQSVMGNANVYIHIHSYVRSKTAGQTITYLQVY